MSGSSSSNPDAALQPRTAPEPLQFTVHSMPRLDLGSEEARRRTITGRWTLLLVLLACAAPVVASYLAYYVIRPEARSNYAALIEPARAIPPSLPLQDLEGRAIDPLSLHGQWLIVVVGSASCDGACEGRLYAQRQLREMTGRDRDRIDKVWLVTDTAPIKPELRSALDAAPSTQVLRVPAADLAQWLTPAEGEAIESHLYLVDPMGRWMMRAPAALDPARFKRDIDRLLRASAAWDTAGRAR